MVTRCHKKTWPCCTGRVPKLFRNLFPSKSGTPVTIQHNNKAKSFWQEIKRLWVSPFSRISTLSPTYPTNNILGKPPKPLLKVCPFLRAWPQPRSTQKFEQRAVISEPHHTKVPLSGCKSLCYTKYFSLFVETGSKAFTAWLGHQNL